MPFALLFALLVSLGIHLLLLLGPEIDWSVDVEDKTTSTVLIAELKPAPLPSKIVSPTIAAEKRTIKSETTRARKPAVPLEEPKQRKRPAPPAPTAQSAQPVLSIPDAVSARPETELVSPSETAPAMEETQENGSESESAPTPAPASSGPVHRLAANGAIDYRVDRGDANFAIGIARHQWEIDGDHYRLTSMVQSTGIVWLFKDFRVEMESRGTMTDEGLRPDFFVLRRNDKPAWEKAFFDWQRMKVRVGDGAEQDLDAGAQDFLSFNYQLGFLPESGAGSVLPIATGRKYSRYAFESLGDEEIDIPAGHLRTLHLRAPGDNTTELWLAYEYQLLPVKIRHVDSKGDSLVQVATHIQMSPP